MFPNWSIYFQFTFGVGSFPAGGVTEFISALIVVSSRFELISSETAFDD